MSLMTVRFSSQAWGSCRTALGEPALYDCVFLEGNAPGRRSAPVHSNECEPLTC
jgi:hypothetical protein